MNDRQRTLIAAYHDGELEPDGSRLVQEMLDTDPAARAYLSALERADKALRDAFDPILNEPIPDHMLATVGKLRKPRIWHSVVSLSLAASLVLAALMLFRVETLDQRMLGQMVDIRQQVAQLRHQTLEHVPSGTAAAWVDSTGGTRAEVTPIKTYRTAGNQFCREYEERIEDADGVEIRRGIACRTGKAKWPDLAANRGAAPSDARF